MSDTKSNDLRVSKPKASKLLRIDNIETSDFMAQMKLLDPVLIGRGREIAEKAGIKYNAYLNCRQGRSVDKKVMTDILEASRMIARSIKHHLNSINL